VTSELLISYLSWELLELNCQIYIFWRVFSEIGQFPRKNKLRSLAEHSAGCRKLWSL